MMEAVASNCGLPNLPNFIPGPGQGRKSFGGFTLVEVVGVVCVVGILAAIAVSKWIAFSKGAKLDGEARALYNEIAHARAQAMKKDLPYLMGFDLSGNAYAVFEDRNGNGSADAGEEVTHRSLGREVAFGAPPNGPAKGPGGQGYPASKVEGGWVKAMVLTNDRAATVNAGAAYLYAPALARIICVRMPANSQHLEMWRWDGAAWAPM